MVISLSNRTPLELDGKTRYKTYRVNEFCELGQKVNIRNMGLCQRLSAVTVVHWLADETVLPEPPALNTLQSYKRHNH